MCIVQPKGECKMTTNIRKLGLIAGLVLCPITANATTIMGMGNLTCMAWSFDAAYPNSQAYFTMTAWVEGFLSGSSFAGPKSYDPIAQANFIDVDHWIDKYCSQNQKDTIVQAAISFYENNPYEGR
jgi:hypothetical protein